jgi:hypothetical protein
MVVLGWWWAAAAGAAPLSGAIVATPSVSGADVRGSLAARLGSPSGSAFGAEVRWAEVSKAWIDGWPVKDGSAASALVHGAVPLVRAERFRLDLRGNVGARWLFAREVEGPDDRSLAQLTEVGPRATLTVADGAAVWLGFDNIVDFQLDPSFATDGLGQLLNGGVVVAPTDDWQLALTGETGGIYGYDGDGGKYAARVGLSLRFAPRVAGDWLWL